MSSSGLLGCCRDQHNERCAPTSLSEFLPHAEHGNALHYENKTKYMVCVMPLGYLDPDTVRTVELLSTVHGLFHGKSPSQCHARRARCVISVDAVPSALSHRRC